MVKKKYFLVLDTETCNSLEQPIPYDIGWVVCDRHGNIYEERSFVIADSFIDLKEAMKSAYYAEKIPKYWVDIKAKTRTLTTMWTIRKLMNEDIKKYNISKVGAYNMGFDKRALNNLIRYHSKSFIRWWFPFGIEFFCIWSMACDSILNRPSYIKFALENDYVSEAGNIQTNAEKAFNYINNTTDFIESHTGLEDVKIEVAIMAKCYAQHKKMNSEINSACWVKVQNKRKEMGV